MGFLCRVFHVLLAFVFIVTNGQITTSNTQIKLFYRRISTPFNNPIGVDYSETTNTLLLTNNYPSGNGGNFRIIFFNGTQTQFSNVAKLTDELKVATVRAGNTAGFIAGDLFTGNGRDGEVIRVTDAGSRIINPWCKLPAGVGLMRGSLYVDRTGVWGDKLLVVTTKAFLFTIDSGDAQCSSFRQIASGGGVHWEGLITVPNDPVTYGGLAGKAVIGAEDQKRMWLVSTNGTTQQFNMGFGIEDIDLIAPGENFFGVNYGRGILLGVEEAQWKAAGLQNKILLTNEFPGDNYVLDWDFANNRPRVNKITPDNTSPDYPSISQWEHISFAPAGINEILPPDFSLCIQAENQNGVILANNIVPLSLPNGNNAVQNYNYGLSGSTSSASAYPVPVVDRFQVYFAKSSRNQFTLNFLVDSASSGNPGGNLQLSLTHSNFGGEKVGFLVQDDRSLISNSADIADSYPANANGLIFWQWKAAVTDGAVVGFPSTDPFSLQSLDFIGANDPFVVTMSVVSSVGITSWVVLNETAPNTFQAVEVNLADTLTLRRYSCTCGNGVVDKFEQCDLGAANGQPGSCCTSDCKFSLSTTVCRASNGPCDVAEQCTGTSSACPADTFLSSSTICRSSAGVCDIQETCTGFSAACPADSLRANSFVCRASAGICDSQETCTGSSVDCPSDAFVSSTTVCRTSNGPCDVAEQCTGSAAACPADNFLPSSTVCRSSAGVCDVQETCTGSSAPCPSDSFAPPSTVCRSIAGPCDVEEKCTGSSVTCPSDAFLSSAVTCRASAGVCDVAEQCTGTAAACPSNSFQSTSVVCRASAGICDVAENCPGNSASCPSNSFQANTVTCRASAGVCDVAEQCTGSAAACPSDSFQANTVTCRSSAGVCDVAENCPGNAATCPTDVFQPTSVTCRVSAGVCDVAEQCTGSGVECPSDSFLSSSSVCRASNGVCDVPENCPGNGAACPTDVFQSSTVTCRNSAGVCDVAENCPGNAAACPTDIFLSSSVICRASAGDCDIQETCTGSAAACPSDSKQNSNFVCRDVAGVCDLAENCDGISVLCPNNTFVTDGSNCDDDNACTVTSSCSSGFCIGVDTLCAGVCGDGVVAASEDCDLAANNGAPGSCCTAQCKFAQVGTVCRSSSGICDVAETCTGSSDSCPSDTFLPNTITCRASAGDCDISENCPGNSASCPSDSFKANTVVCRATADVCDVQETCTGSSASCPSDSFQANTVTCRVSAGDCDVAEQCTGSSSACPSDSFLSAATVCRSSAGVCDVAENCPGNAAACPTDTFQANTVVCRNSAGVCDVAENCPGNAAACPLDAVKPSSSVCRNAAGDCDLDDFCDGTGVTCTADVLKSSSIICRAAAGPCDLDDFCTGSTTTCPTDAFKASSTVCRASAGDCDVAEQCTGSAAACPSDSFLSAATVCRASNGICDVAENCPGNAAACPVDSFQPNTLTCRDVDGPCDIAESCTGTGALCPNDEFSSALTVCRSAAGDCDVDDFCSGNGAACTANILKDASVVCRNASGACDPLERCTGAAVSCPADINDACPDCNGTNCNGHGVCSYTNGDPSLPQFCTCDPRYRGEFCEIPICDIFSNCTSCSTHPDCGWCCATETCIAGSPSGPKDPAQCPGSFGFHVCCETTVCLNGGQCDCGTCDCVPGTKGDNCSVILGCDGSETKPGDVPVSIDACNVCAGNGTSCVGCDGIPNGQQLDECGICGGSGTTCYNICDHGDCITCTLAENCVWCGTIGQCFHVDQQASTQCDRWVTNCALDFFNNLTPTEKGIGGGVIAAIVIGIIVAIIIAGFGGKKGYDLWRKHSNAMSGVQDNPLYEGGSSNNINPLFEESA